MKGSGVNIPLEFDEQLAKALHKPIIRNFKNQFILDLKIKGLFGKYAWVVPLKDKKGDSVADVFQKTLDN